MLAKLVRPPLRGPGGPPGRRWIAVNRGANRLLSLNWTRGSTEVIPRTPRSSVSRKAPGFSHGVVYAHKVFVDEKLIGTSPYPSELTSISTVVLASRLSASSRYRAASIAYIPPLVIMLSQIRERA